MNKQLPIDPSKLTFHVVRYGSAEEMRQAGQQIQRRWHEQTATHKHKETKSLVEATQFDPQQPWPGGVVSWRTVNCRPRDMSWGFVQTCEGRVHVCAFDWIVRDANDVLSVHKPEVFEQIYEPLEETAR